MELIVSILMRTLAIIISAYVIPGVKIDTFFTAVVVAIFLGIVNAVLKPILVILTLPINILTLGLFTLVINALLILLVGRIVPGFKVDGFWTAFWFGLVLALVSWFLNSIT